MSEKNARQIEKDIMIDVPSTSAGNSEIINLFGQSGNASKFSCQAIYDVQAPSAKTFDSGVLATLVEQDLTFTALTRSADGNDITIEYTGGAVDGDEIVTVNGTNIVVQIDDNVSTATQIKTALDASIEAMELITVTISGTASDAQVIFAETNLAGGVDSEVVVADSQIIIPSHGFTTGFKIRLTTTGTLPDPLLTATDYFIIKISNDIIQLASSLVNALAGTAITLIDQGSSGAVSTITGVALASVSIVFQKSNDGVNWINLDTPTSITVDGNFITKQPNVSYKYFRAVKALTSGQVDLKCNILVIGQAV